MNTVLKERISDEERAQREEAFNYACASVELEGFKLTPENKVCAERYINGEITLEEFMAGGVYK